MIRQKVQPRILGKIGEELEIVEKETIREKKNGNDHERKRN